MSEFTVVLQGLKSGASQFKNTAKALSNAASEINNLKHQTHDSESFVQIRSALGRIGTDLTTDKGNLDTMADVLSRIVSEYERTEKEVASLPKTFSNNPIQFVTSIVKNITGVLVTDSNMLPNKWEIGGLLGKIMASGMNWKYKEDSDGNLIKKLSNLSLLDAKVSGEKSLVKGTVKGSVGNLSGEVEGAIGTIAASGKVTVGLMKDGKVRPQISADAEISAVAAQGSVNGKYGTDENNAHVKGDVKVGSATASAGAGLGLVTVKDKATGETKTITGAKVEAKAEAYAVEGRASGGVTICGIKIDVGITGKAGGVGGSVGGYIGTGGASGSIGAGLGLGLGVDFSIDWSGFKPFWKK